MIGLQLASPSERSYAQIEVGTDVIVSALVLLDNNPAGLSVLEEQRKLKPSARERPTPYRQRRFWQEGIAGGRTCGVYFDDPGAPVTIVAWLTQTCFLSWHASSNA